MQQKTTYYYCAQLPYTHLVIEEFLEHGDYDFDPRILPADFKTIRQELVKKARKTMDIWMNTESHDGLLPTTYFGIYIDRKDMMSLLIMSDVKINTYQKEWILPIYDVKEFEKRNGAYKEMFD